MIFSKEHIKQFQIFKPGTHRAMMGQTVTATPEAMTAFAENYNRERPDGQPRRLAPLYLGHPGDPNNTNPQKTKPYGLITNLFVDEGNLHAYAVVDPQLTEWVRSGKYKAVSCGLLGNTANFAAMTLDHVAILNNPAVKGMEPLNFSDNADAVTFVQDFDALGFGGSHETAAQFSAAGERCDFSEQHGLHDAALRYQVKFGGSYENAVYAVIREGEIANFAAPSEEMALHERIMKYRYEKGVSYEAAFNQVMHEIAFSKLTEK